MLISGDRTTARSASVNPISTISSRRTRTGRRRATRGPRLLPASMPAPSGTTAAHVTVPASTNAIAHTICEAPISMFLSALALTSCWSTSTSISVSTMIPEPPPK